MKSTISRTLALAVGLVFATACPDCNEMQPEDAGPVDVTAAATELCVVTTLGDSNLFYSALHSLTRCSATDPWPEIDDATRQDIEDGCVEGNAFFDMFVVALEGDRVSLDIDRVRSCVDKGRAARGTVTPFAYNSGDSSLIDLISDPDCDGAVTPLLSDGDTCEQSWDCPDDLPCQADPPDSPTLRCLAPAGEGDRCGGSRGCGVGLSCIAEVCTAPLASGTDCVNNDAPCAEGTFCDQADSGVCQPKKPANATCAADIECEDGLGCATDTLVCTAPTPALADGQTCEVGVDACDAYCSVCRKDSAAGEFACRDRADEGGYCEADNDCRDPFVCDANSCATAPLVQLPGLGDECGVNDVPFECEEGACVFSRCVAGVENDPCETDFSQCQVGLVCAPDPGGAAPNEGDCVAEPAVGDLCIEGQCGAGAFCNGDGECAAVRDPGDSCAEDQECASGLCLGSNTCAAPSPSCYTARGTFLQILTLALLLPVVVRVRRRRREA